MPAEIDKTFLGYHGTSRAHALSILRDQEIKVSDNAYDWLGRGAYFWEDGLARAWKWAEEIHGPENAAVIRAHIRSQHCISLMDDNHHSGLAIAYGMLAENAELDGDTLPKNVELRRPLDFAVFNIFCDELRPDVHALRAPFEEGVEIYPGSKIRSLAHIQICVRNSLAYDGPFTIVSRDGT